MWISLSASAAKAAPAQRRDRKDCSRARREMLDMSISLTAIKQMHSWSAFASARRMTRFEKRFLFQ